MPAIFIFYVKPRTQAAGKLVDKTENAAVAAPANRRLGECGAGGRARLAGHAEYTMLSCAYHFDIALPRGAKKREIQFMADPFPIDSYDDVARAQASRPRRALTGHSDHANARAAQPFSLT
jgi:hypothetical protein